MGLQQDGHYKSWIDSTSQPLFNIPREQDYMCINVFSMNLGLIEYSTALLHFLSLGSGMKQTDCISECNFNPLELIRSERKNKTFSDNSEYASF